MKNPISKIIPFLLLFILVSAIFSFFNEPSQEEQISLSELVSKINSEEVRKIVVLGNELEIIYKNEEKAKSTKEIEQSLIVSLTGLGVNLEKIKTVEIEFKQEGGIPFWLGTLGLTLLPMILMLVFFWVIFKQAKTGAMQTFDFTKAKARLFGAGIKPEQKITFNDVAGLEGAKEELEEIVDFLQNPQKYLKMGAKIPRGVLLIGPPGTGKTMLARAVANEAGVPFFSISGSEFIELFVGVGASRTRSLFAQAKKVGRAIIFIDEIDSIGRTRGVGFGGGHEEREQTLNQILSEMDGFERDAQTIVMAASVSKDTPVLIKQNREYKLLPISEVVDSYYQNGEEGIEKLVSGLEVLGFEKKETKRKVIKNTYFGNGAFKKVRSVFRHKVNEIYEIQYMGGTLKTTGNHSVFIRTSQGLKAKAVVNLQPGDTLVAMPFKANRTTQRKGLRAHKFDSDFNLELPIWQPLFEKFEPVKAAYEYAQARMGETSQTQLGKAFGFSQTTIGKWQKGICGPRALSRNYYQHKDILPEKVKVTPDLMRLFGYYTAEGYARKEIDFCFNRKEKKEIEDIKNLMKKIFNLEPSKIKFITPGAINIVYYCRPLSSFFINYCGKGAKNKHVPSFLFEAPFEYFQEFFRGYFAGDGHTTKSKKGEATSISKQLILELNWLFRMHGFKSYIHSFVAKQGRKIYNGKPLKQTIAWRLGFGKTQNPLNSNDIRMQGSVHRPIVKKVRKIPYKDYVYDFCGCENEAFFAGESPVLAHNTNRPDVLDPALLRPGRFDRRIVLDLPDIKDRQGILKIHSRGKPLAPDADFKEIAERTPGFSGADLENLVNEAAIAAAKQNKGQIFQKEFFESIEKVLLGPERRSHILSKKEKQIAAFHEAGHALVAASIPETEQVRKISIIARGMAAGYTLKMPREERKIRTKSEFLAEIAVLFGGYAAEKIKFAETTTGASNDLQQASELARKLVKEYGMSALGPIAFGEKQESMFWEQGLPEKRNYSEKVAAGIDEQVSIFINQAQNRAEKILNSKRKTLEKIAQILIEKETIEKQEFEKIIEKESTHSSIG